MERSGFPETTDNLTYCFNLIMPLQSHYQPNLLLKTHIAQVQKAADFLLSSHSPIRPNTAALLKAIIQCHDLGKGSPAFQAYITNNPTKYTGDPRTKSHALLSAVLATLWAQQQKWAPLDTLVLTQTVLCHHSGFKTLIDLEQSLELEFDDPLEEQYAALDLKMLSETTGLNLQQLKNDDFEAAKRWLFKRQKIEKQLTNLTIDKAIGFRLWTQFCLSVLLEADKALLALQGDTNYLQKITWDKPPECVDKYLKGANATPMNEFRALIQSQVMLNSQKTTQPNLTLTLPTGAGKTLIAARWALTTRQQMASQRSIKPKIIVVLPYLSIIEQTEKIYHQLLETQQTNTEILIASHSLSDRHYELEGEKLNDKYAEFFLNTWRSEIVITTFDQFLLALFSEKTRHLMRFHNLMDAVIILDEVQTLPPKLWDIINQTLHALTKEAHTKILMMSATQPQFLSPAQELAGTPKQITDIFKQCQRYQIHLKHRTEQPIDEFTHQLISRVKTWLTEKKRIMITLNTRASAKLLWKQLHQNFHTQITVHLISADVTPRDRLKKIQTIIEDIKTNHPCLLVTTQTVEAGVDIDMDIVIRDFAPLDKIVQIAGRCNRHNKRGKHGGYVEIVNLHNQSGNKFANYIYDKVLLSTTHEILKNHDIINEENVLTVSDDYFQQLRQNMNIGKTLTEQYAYWQELENSVHALLRQQGEQISFIVLDDEDSLRYDIEQALKIRDRWKKRNALKTLAGKINERSINVYARRGFHPEDYAELLGYFWILKSDYYTKEAGLDLKLDDDIATYIL
jgi:CRISPR-associated endonuclease/helicase Cas3